jgi:hypothetical protein
VLRDDKENAMSNKYGIMTSVRRPVAWTEELIISLGEGLSLVQPKVEQADFVQRCVDAAPERCPKPGVRDTRKQDIVRALRRMASKDRLPFKVVGDWFVF